MNQDRMLGMVYYHLLEQTAKLQLEVAQQLWVDQCFGDDSIPVNRARRSHRHVLKSHVEGKKQVIIDMNKKIEEYIGYIRQMEAFFEDQEHADLAAFADYIKQRMKEDAQDAAKQG